MNADVAHAEFSRTFDERVANIGAVKFKADACGPPLRVALPCCDGIAVDRILHKLKRSHLWTRIRHHHGVEEEAMSTLHAVNENSDPVCLLERKWVSFWQFGHEREHRELGITVHEYVLDELLGGKAVNWVLIPAGALRKVGEDLLPILAGGAAPSASRIDHVGLNVEYELIAS